MNVSAVSLLPPDIKQLVVLATATTRGSTPHPELNAAIDNAIAYGWFNGKQDELFPVHAGDCIGILTGLGEDDKRLTPRRLSGRVKKALLSSCLQPDRPVGILPSSDRPDEIRAIVDGVTLGLYRWDQYITKKEGDRDFTQLTAYIQTSHAALVKTASMTNEGVNLARNLGNENADVADSDFLEKQIRAIVTDDERCTIEVLNQTELEENGLRLILAVNKGSRKEPKLIIVTYKGATESEPYIAIVGKGITFDSGGLNLKSSGFIESMRTDMCGAAAVIGTLRNALALQLNVNVHFVCAIAENAVDAGSYKPGDVIISYAGKSVEIANTDAEGRLILADANSYVAKNYNPAAIVNIATLTGAVGIALGRDHTGLLSTHQVLADDLFAAGLDAHDPAWQLPIYPELEEHVKSPFADIKNTGKERLAGTLSAAEFLRQFAQFDHPDRAWAHLDIAGTGRQTNDHEYLSDGASGAGVRLLTQFLTRKASR